MKRPLCSWRVVVRSAHEAYGRDQLDGSPFSYYPVHDYYIVARTKSDATAQAKVMAGYVLGEDCRSRKHVRACTQIMVLE